MKNTQIWPELADGFFDLVSFWEMMVFSGKRLGCQDTTCKGSANTCPSRCPSGAGRAFANATTRALRELVHAEARAEVARRRRREPSPGRVLDDAREDASLPDSAAETRETRETQTERGVGGGGVDGVDASSPLQAEQAAAGPSGASGLRRSKRARANANGGR